MTDNVTEEKPHDCYWCGRVVCGASDYSGFHFFRCCNIECTATGPWKKKKEEALAAWNSLAARLKPVPKKVTVRRWVNVFDDRCGATIFSVPFADQSGAEVSAKKAFYQHIDTVEVEITFTDRRN